MKRYSAFFIGVVGLAVTIALAILISLDAKKPTAVGNEIAGIAYEAVRFGHFCATVGIPEDDCVDKIKVFFQ